MKNIKRVALIITSIAACCAAVSTLAAVPVPIGWYAEGNVGASKSQSANYGANTTASNDSGFGWNVNAGYKFMPFFAAELGYTSYANTKITNSTSGLKAGKDKHYSYDIAAKAILPVSTSGFELFGKLGVGRINSHVSATNPSVAASTGLNTGTRNATGLYLGLGADYAFTPNIIANMQWARAKGSSSTGNLDLYSLGVSYLFC